MLRGLCRVFFLLTLVVSAAASSATLTTADCTIAAGGIGESNASNGLALPYGITVDALGNLFVADTFNNRVMRWEDGASTGTRVAGNGSDAGLSLPVRLLVRSDGALVISDYSNGRVLLWEQGATQGTVLAENVVEPWGLALDESGSLLLARYDLASIRRFEPGSTSGTDWYGDGSRPLVDVKLGDDGFVYVLDAEYGVLRYPANLTDPSPTGGEWAVRDFGVGSGANQIDTALGFAVDYSLGLWLADVYNQRILRCPGTGAGQDCEVMLAGLTEAVDVALDASQSHFYVADASAHRVWKCPTLLNTSTSTVSSTTSSSTISSSTTSSSTTSSSTTSSGTSSSSSSTTSSSTATSTTSSSTTSTASSSTTSHSTTSSSTSGSSTTSSSGTTTSTTSTGSSTTSTTTSSTSTTATSTSTSSSTSSSTLTRTTTSGPTTAASTPLPKPTPSPGPPPSPEEAATELLSSVANVSAALISQLTDPGVDRATVQIQGGSLTAVRLAPPEDLANSSEGGVTLEVEGPQGALELTLPTTLFTGIQASSTPGDSLTVVVSAFSLETSAALGGQQQRSAQASQDASSEEVVELQVLSAISIDLQYLLSGESPEVARLSDPIVFQLPGANFTEGLRCAFWEEELLVWSYDGVSASSDLAPGQPLECKTFHLSFFGAILEVIQGFLKTFECAQLGLLSAEAIRSVFTDAWWPYSEGACVFWGVLAVLLSAFLVAIRVDFVRDSSHRWRDEFFLVALGAEVPAEEPAGQPAGQPADEEEAEAEKPAPASPLAWVAFAGLLCSTCLTWMWESSALREALDEVFSSWFEYWSQLRSSCESLLEVFREGMGSGTAVAISHRATTTMVMASSRRLVAASMGMSNEAVTFVLEDEDLQEFITEMPKDAAVGTRADDWKTSEDQRVAWTSLHDTVVHHLLQHTQRHTVCGLPRIVLEFLFFHNPFCALFVCDIFHTCKKRVLLLAMDVLGAMALGCLFFDAAGMVRGKPLRRGDDCETAGRSPLWIVGRFLAIATGSLLVSGLPLALVESLHTKGFRKLDYRGSPAWRKQLRVWAVQDVLVWSFALAYLAFCTFFILVFLASIGPEDHADWSIVELLALAEDFFFLPALVALLVPGMTASFLLLSARVTRTDRSKVLRQTHETLLRKTSLMLPVTRV